MKVTLDLSVNQLNTIKELVTDLQEQYDDDLADYIPGTSPPDQEMEELLDLSFELEQILEQL